MGPIVCPLDNLSWNPYNDAPRRDRLDYYGARSNSYTVANFNIT